MAVKPFKTRFVNELALFAGLLFTGFVLLPLAIYLVGNLVFGTYDGGYMRFFGGISQSVVNGDRVTWFLVLSPYLALQVLRLTLLIFRKTARP